VHEFSTSSSQPNTLDRSAWVGLGDVQDRRVQIGAIRYM
jgi:hypothetical protein